MDNTSDSIRLDKRAHLKALYRYRYFFVVVRSHSVNPLMSLLSLHTFISVFQPFILQAGLYVPLRSWLGWVEGTSGADAPLAATRASNFFFFVFVSHLTTSLFFFFSAQWLFAGNLLIMKSDKHWEFNGVLGPKRHTIFFCFYHF